MNASRPSVPRQYTRPERAVVCAASKSAVAAAGAQWALGGSGRAGDAMPSASTNVSVVT